MHRYRRFPGPYEDDGHGADPEADFTIEDDVQDVFEDDHFDIAACHPASGLVVAFSALGLEIDPQQVRKSWEDEKPLDLRRLRACLNLTILLRDEDSTGLQLAGTFGRLLRGVTIGPKPKKKNTIFPPPFRLKTMGGCTVYPQGIITTATSTLKITPEGYAYEVQGPTPFNMRILEITPQGAVNVGDKSFALAALYNMAGRGNTVREGDEYAAVEHCIRSWSDKIIQVLPSKFTHLTVYENRTLYQLGGVGLAAKIVKAEEAIVRLAKNIATATAEEARTIFKRLKKMRVGPYSDVGKTPIGPYYDTTVAKQLLVLDHFRRHPDFRGKVTILGLGDSHISHVSLPMSVKAYEIKKAPGQFARDAFSNEAFEELTNCFCVSDVFADHSGGLPSDYILSRQLENFPIILASKTFSPTAELYPVAAKYAKYYQIVIITGGRTHNTEVFFTFERRPVDPSLTNPNDIKASLDLSYEQAPFPLLSAQNIAQVMLAKFTRLSLYHSAHRNLAYVNGQTPATLTPEQDERFCKMLGLVNGLEPFESYRVSLVTRTYGSTVGNVLNLQKLILRHPPSYRIVGNESRIIPIPENVEHEGVEGWLEPNEEA